MCDMGIFDGPSDPDICEDCNGTGKRPCDLAQCQCCHGHGRYSLSRAAFVEHVRLRDAWRLQQPWVWRLGMWVRFQTSGGREWVREVLR